LTLQQSQAAALVLNYKAGLIAKGLKEATINRRLSAIKSLVKYGRRIGVTVLNLDDIQGEKITAYRDTTGINTNQIMDVLSVPDKSTAKGKRDYALLRLFWENALRRGEISALNIADYNPEEKTLSILGKGKGTQKEIIDLSEKTANALNEWLTVRGSYEAGEALFVSLDNSSKGHRITGTALYKIIQAVTKQAGITKKMSPHRIRHSSITAALEATNGNVTLVKQLSRHSKVETLMIYNDHREKQQKKVTELLSNLA
jgi:integrase/recombinase XerC